MEKTKCNLCGFEWIPRTENPISCPKCKRYDWKKKEEVVEAAF